MNKPWPLPPIDDKLRERLAHGARLRAAMMQQLERGEEPQPEYRVRWLQESAHAIILLLAERGEAFLAAQKDDALSFADFCDAVWSARSILLNQGAAWSKALAEHADPEDGAV